MASFIKVQAKAGVFKDDTPLTAALFYTDSDKIRFWRGLWQIIGGWERAAADTFAGICRGLFVWANNLSQPLGFLGTHTNAYAFYDGDLYDITPVVERGTLTNPFTTTAASAVVTVAHTAHGRTEDSTVIFSNASAVGGITVDGSYTVTEVLDANSYTITHGSAAGSGASGGGTVYYEYLLNVGLVDGLGGLGYGVGGFGLGDYGEGADVDELFPRTWAPDNWGQNLVAAPRGGPICEWAPGYSAPELVTNGNFASGAGWTTTAGWSIGGGVANASVTVGGLTTTIIAEAGAWHLLQVDVTRSAGSVQCSVNGTNVGDAIAAAGHQFIPFNGGAGGSQELKFTGASFTGTLDNVSVKQILTLEPIPEAPSQNTCIVVTAEDMIMAGGTIDETTDEFDPLLVRWCARRNNRLWTPGFQQNNTSGFFRLANASKIVKMLNVRGGVLILTDDSPYLATFNPDPTINYSFTPLGRGNSCIGAQAATVASGVAFWIGATGEFRRFAGGGVEQIPSSVRQDFIENLARGQNDKIALSGISAFNEVIVLYPDQRDGNECSRYLKYNWAEGEAGCWDVGTFDRSCWVDNLGFGFPLAAGTDGKLYYQEKGNSADGGALEGFIQSGAFNLRDGKLMSVMGLIPDFHNLVGGLQLTVRTYLYPNATPVTSGPFAITSTTDKVDIRTQGRQVDMRWDFNAAPMSGRSGTQQIDARGTGSCR